MAKTKYTGIYTDEKGQFYYETELGIDKATGKRVRKKGRKDKDGKKFTTASEANKELTRIKREYHKANGYSNYRITYADYMDEKYIPFYKTEVRPVTVRKNRPIFDLLKKHFGDKILREISVDDVQDFRTWLLSDVENGGSGHSKNYASQIFGVLRKTLDVAITTNHLEHNVSRQVKAVGRVRVDIPYWTKTEFEKVINQIYTDDFYGHLTFVTLWVYFTTGLRVNEASALYWEDIDFKNKRMRVHHMLEIKNKTIWKRNPEMKTENARRVISLDDDTVSILKTWKERQARAGLGRENDFVLSYDGAPILKENTANVIKKYSKLAGVKRIEVKGLRHSHASYMINEFNVSILILSKRLGHASPEITLKHYAHMYPVADETIADEIVGNINIKTSSVNKVQFMNNKTIPKVA